MREDLRPYWVKKAYLYWRRWYVDYFLRPECASLGDHSTFMKPRYVIISGPNIHIGDCFTAVAEPQHRVEIGVWGREIGTGTIRIGRCVLMSPGSRISASDEIVIGDGVMMANGVYITDSDWHTVYDRTRRAEVATPVRVGNNVWIGDHATVLKGVNIGDNSVVAARAVVTRDVPANVIVAGNPARVVRELEPGREIVTRMDYFADPVGQAAFFDAVDREVLRRNSFWRWILGCIYPGFARRRSAGPR
ncbi:MAG: acyltransferase [Halieaceae bacterium]|jgi:acetyltransferase-like isoleucine patch superfamily enzyme|nr:acyltransferase [Halieaceae bacterium]